jgi:hypothetical protein
LRIGRAGQDIWQQWDQVGRGDEQGNERTSGLTTGGRDNEKHDGTGNELDAKVRQQLE